MTTVAYQGEPGAFGEEAIIGYFGADAVEPTPMPTFSAVCAAVDLVLPFAPAWPDGYWLRTAVIR